MRSSTIRIISLVLSGAARWTSFIAKRRFKDVQIMCAQFPLDLQPVEHPLYISDVSESGTHMSIEKEAKI